MKTLFRQTLIFATAAGVLLVAPSAARASSHMDAPLITLDDAANTTDVYAFVQDENGRRTRTSSVSKRYSRTPRQFSSRTSGSSGMWTMPPRI